jgi:hypothetical protein
MSASQSSVPSTGSKPRYIPTITTWNRLEGRPRTANFDRALKAEIRDPLWMLSKQWQMGEFLGEDAASAILAKVHLKTTELTTYQPGDAITSPFDTNTPLEVKVEHQAISFKSGEQEISLDLRLLMGRQWLKLLNANSLTLKDESNSLTLKDEYLSKYGFSQPDPDDISDVHLCSHIEVWQQFAAIANRGLDGYELYLDLKLAADKVSPPEGSEEKLKLLGVKFISWFEKLYYQPIEDNNPSWKPSYLEHQFACSAPKNEGEKVLITDEYYHGHLDWYNLDIHDVKETLTNNGGGETASTELVENQFTLSFLPSPVTFPGMPHNRWWTLEDWKTNLGNINPSTPDINQLMLLDFSLNYANDWFIVPFTLSIGSIAEVSGVMVTNVFGEKIWIEAAGKGKDEEWNKWGMFNLNVRGKMEIPTDLSLLLLPTAPKVLEGKPLEEIFLLRDEIANMVWGIESKVPLATGKSKAGREAGIELRNKYQQFVVPSAEPQDNVENDAKIKYQIVNTVPEEWIPFIPVHKEKEASNRQIQLQRAAMPRILEEDTVTPAKIEPRTSILREGLDKGETYFLHEEEIPRAGIKVHKSFQRTRWLNGKVFTWVGFRKQVGRGEGRSGLAFDQIIPKK